MDFYKSSVMYLLQYFFVHVVRLYKLVLSDPADDIRHLILLLCQGLGDHLVSPGHLTSSAYSVRKHNER